jgi:SAM-dependent methyltransferase
VSPTLRAEGISPTFLKLLETEPLDRLEVLDVGTGRGRLALALAPHCRRVVGIDIDAAAINEARHRAEASGFRNAEFFVADAEKVEFIDIIPAKLHLHPTMVTAHLYLSDTLVEEASKALGPGQVLAIVGFHTDQWRETGRRSRFAWDESTLRDLLQQCDFAVERLEVEAEVKTFGSVEEALAAVIGLEERWRQDGRWFHYIKYLEQGGRQLTRSHLIVKARRR